MAEVETALARRKRDGLVSHGYMAKTEVKPCGMEGAE